MHRTRFEHAHIHFTQPAIGAHRTTALLGNARRGLLRAAQIATDNLPDPFLGQILTDLRCLQHPQLSERAVGMPLDPARGIPLGFSVTNQVNLCHCVHPRLCVIQGHL